MTAEDKEKKTEAEETEAGDNGSEAVRETADQQAESDKKTAKDADKDQKEVPEKEPEEEKEKPKAETKPEAKAEPKEESKVSETDQLKKQLADNKEKTLRLLAEFDNYRKRTTKEQAESFERGETKVIEALLPVIDNLERAITAGQTDGKDPEDDPFFKGIRMTYDQVLRVLKTFGVEQMEDEGKTFDPAQHNAMMHVDDEDKGEQEIVQVFQKGYKMNGKVIRPSLVKVAN